MSGPSPYLTALLVDYGPVDLFFSPEALDGQDCIGPGIPGDPGCFNRQDYSHGIVDREIVTRGWIDVRNRLSPAVSTPVTASTTVGVRTGVSAVTLTLSQ